MCGCAAHRQLKSQLELLVLKKLPDLRGYRHGHQAPHKVVAGDVHYVLPVKDERRKNEMREDTLEQKALKLVRVSCSCEHPENVTVVHCFHSLYFICRPSVRIQHYKLFQRARRGVSSQRTASPGRGDEARSLQLHTLHQQPGLQRPDLHVPRKDSYDVRRLVLWEKRVLD